MESIRLKIPTVSLYWTIFVIAVVQIPENTAKSIDYNNASVCQTKFCKKIAENIISNMNQSVKPCNDFFQYACGNSKIHQVDNENWDQMSVIANRTQYRLKDILESTWSPTENAALTKAKQLYKACMDTNAVENRAVMSLIELTEKHGGWPMAMSYIDWMFRLKHWPEINANFMKIFGGNSPLFSITMQSDIKNSSSNILWFTIPNPDPIDRHAPFASFNGNVNAYLNSPPAMKYKETIINIAKMMANYKGAYVSDATLATDAHDIVSFEVELKQITMMPATSAKADVNSSYSKTTIDNLQRSCDLLGLKHANGKLQWLNHVENLFSDVPGVKINGSESIAVLPIEYFLKLNILLDKTPVRTIVNTMHWWLVKNLAPYASEKILDVMRASLPDELKPTKPQPRWKNCVTNNEMKHAIAYEYIHQYFSESAKDAAIDMANEIMHGMQREIERSEWLDAYSKQGALRKLTAMKEFIGYPDWYKDNSEVEKYYQDLEITPFFLENKLNVMNFSRLLKLKEFKKPVDRKTWIASPITINAFYFYAGNSLTIPAAMLQVPFFDDQQPDALNYGGIGTVIGHEVSHGFDDVGCQFDATGNVRDWWSNNTKFEYKNKAECFVKKYNKYAITHNNTVFRLDAVRTLSENIADTTGVRAAYEAFQTHAQKHSRAHMKLPGLEHLNSHQLLFLSYAHNWCGYKKLTSSLTQLQFDPHSPAPFRIVGTISNMESFAEAFKCPKGSPMNPIDKCGIW